MSTRAQAAAILDELVALRRDLHRYPEIGLELPLTQKRVVAALDGLGIEVTIGSALSSVVGVLRGHRPGPSVLLRADMDALPVTEEAHVPYASEITGVMHACGHDLHTAALVGAARLLASRRAEIAGNVVFMFQPGEEGYDGARLMIEEGVLDAAGERVVAAYGLHVFSASLPQGVFATRPGTLMGASDEMIVQVHGAGGHGAAPHLATDPIPAACEMVTALQTMVTRAFDVFDPVVLTVGHISAGTCSYVIPSDARIEATIRTFSSATRERVARLAASLCTQLAAAHGLTAEVDYRFEYPPTVNDPAEYELAADTVQDVFGTARFQRLENPIAGAEDFSRVLATVPGAFVFLGAGTAAETEQAPYNHSAEAIFHDGVLADAAAFLTEVALRRLST